jgi:hypothetical protein
MNTTGSNHGPQVPNFVDDFGLYSGDQNVVVPPLQIAEFGNQSLAALGQIQNTGYHQHKRSREVTSSPAPGTDQSGMMDPSSSYMSPALSNTLDYNMAANNPLHQALSHFSSNSGTFEDTPFQQPGHEPNFNFDFQHLPPHQFYPEHLQQQPVVAVARQQSSKRKLDTSGGSDYDGSVVGSQVSLNKTASSARPSIPIRAEEILRQWREYKKIQPGEIPSDDMLNALSTVFNVSNGRLGHWFGNQTDQGSPQTKDSTLGTSVDGGRPILPTKRRKITKREGSSEANVELQTEPNGKYVCTYFNGVELCKHKSAKKDDFRKHMELHHPQASYWCNVPSCSTKDHEYKRRDRVNPHFRDKHPEIHAKGKEEIERHLRRNRVNSANSLHDRLCIFKDCNQTVETWRELIDHLGSEYETRTKWDFSDWRPQTLGVPLRLIAAQLTGNTRSFNGPPGPNSGAGSGSGASPGNGPNNMGGGGDYFGGSPQPYGNQNQGGYSSYQTPGGGGYHLSTQISHSPKPSFTQKPNLLKQTTITLPTLNLRPTPSNRPPTMTSEIDDSPLPNDSISQRNLTGSTLNNEGFLVGPSRPPSNPERRRFLNLKSWIKSTLGMQAPWTPPPPPPPATRERQMSRKDSLKTLLNDLDRKLTLKEVGSERVVVGGDGNGGKGRRATIGEKISLGNWGVGRASYVS